MNRYAQPTLPTVQLGVDFGTSSLVICIPGQGNDGFRTLAFPGWSQEITGAISGEAVNAVPVLILYDQDGKRTIGDEVTRAGAADHPTTARWIRKYLLEESPVLIPAGGNRHISFRGAAADFLGSVISRAIKEAPEYSSMVFVIPSGAPEWYIRWLGDIAQTAGIRSWNTITEPAAVVAGYELIPEPGQAYLIVNWDETELTVSFALSEEPSDHHPAGGVFAISTACDDTGCKAVDDWIAQDVLARSPLKYMGAKAQRIYANITGRSRELYSQLAKSDEALIHIEDPLSGTTLSARISREDIKRILTEHEIPSVLERTSSRARVVASSRGCKGPDTILMTGRGCAIPMVRELVKQQFPGMKILSDHPVDAAARGASIFLPRANLPDRVKNDYALRYWDPKSREHRYRFLVRSGARYPSAGQVARITISAAYDGQTRLGIPLYEMSASPDTDIPDIELVSDPAGGIRFAAPPENTGGGSRIHPVNERTPTLLVADPPALKGEPRFELTFMLDREKLLRVTARDLVTGTLLKKDVPVYKLT
ncbi:MAG: hypothetical protein WCE65_06680 [Methanoregula sp.]